jgi:flavin reductase (DIM6/NTAB) family NADH-FMN oxidoreductase RutF
MRIDPQDFRRTVGQFVTGVTLVTFDDAGEVRAVTANSFTSVSLDPPLVLFCLGKTTSTSRIVHAARGFAVNVLRHDQQELALYFGGGNKANATPPRCEFVPWSPAPRVEDCVAAMGCAMHEIHEGGDHWIIVGRVIGLHAGREGDRPLAFWGGHYGSFHKSGEVVAPDPESIVNPILVRSDRQRDK